jgi:hypothetical protein
MGLRHTQPGARIALAGAAVLTAALLQAGCGGGSTGGPGSANLSGRAAVSTAAQSSFLRACAGRLGAAPTDALACHCALTELQAETTSVSFKADVGVWEENSGGLGFRSLPARLITRCVGEQRVGAIRAPVRSIVSSSVRIAGRPSALQASRFRWPPTKSSVLRNCAEEGAASIANGMTCQLANTIAKATEPYRASPTPQLRAVRVIDPTTGRRTSVVCFFPGRAAPSAVCRAHGADAALLPTPGAEG